MKPENPIGVFDSGLGGLTVAAEIRRQLPNEKILYFGDSARNPYGTKTREEVERYSMEIVEMFRQKQVKAVVIACNTATSAAAPLLRESFDFDIIGMEPALKVAADCKTPSTIAVWATELTLHQEKFERLRNRFQAGHEIIQVACPKLVSLVETGELNHPELVDEVLRDYLDQSRGAEFIVLGCTHFIFFKERIQQLAGDQIRVVDGNEGTVRRLKSLLAQSNLLADNQEGSLEIDNSDPEKIEHSRALVNQLEEQND